MYRIAIRIKKRQYLGWNINAGAKYIFGGKRKELGKTTRSIDANPNCIRTQMPSAGQTITAAFADDVSFPGYYIAYI